MGLTTIYQSIYATFSVFSIFSVFNVFGIVAVLVIWKALTDTKFYKTNLEPQPTSSDRKKQQAKKGVKYVRKPGKR